MTNLLTVPEAAERLKMSRQTIYSLCKAGKLPYIKVGGSVRIVESKLDEMIESAAEANQPAAAPASPTRRSYQMQVLKI